jgi:hypothetical protein
MPIYKIGGRKIIMKGTSGVEFGSQVCIPVLYFIGYL